MSWVFKRGGFPGVERVVCDPRILGIPTFSFLKLYPRTHSNDSGDNWSLIQLGYYTQRQLQLWSSLITEFSMGIIAQLAKALNMKGTVSWVQSDQVGFADPTKKRKESGHFTHVLCDWCDKVMAHMSNNISNMCCDTHVCLVDVTVLWCHVTKKKPKKQSSTHAQCSDQSICVFLMWWSQVVSIELCHDPINVLKSCHTNQGSFYMCGEKKIGCPRSSFPWHSRVHQPVYQLERNIFKSGGLARCTNDSVRVSGIKDMFE